MKGISPWQELAKVARNRTALPSKGVVVTISESATQGLALRVELVDLPLIHRWLRKLQRNRGKFEERELLNKLENLTNPNLIELMHRSLLRFQSVHNGRPTDMIWRNWIVR